MKQFEGYIKHEILIDADNPSHIVITSCWTKRELADQTVTEYAISEPVRLLSPLRLAQENEPFFMEIFNIFTRS